MRSTCIHSIGLILLLQGGGLCAAEPLRETVPSRLGRFELKCPVCRQSFMTVACIEANTREGTDRDLFARAVGPQPEYYRISTCPRCGYSGYDADFDTAVIIPPDVRDKILKKPKLKLPQGFTPASDPLDLDAADRYELAITCYQWRQRSDEALAWLHLRASWIARDEGSVLPPDPPFARVMRFVERWRPETREVENQADLEMKLATSIAEATQYGRFNRYQKPYVELALAMILRRHGENRQAGPRINRLAEYPEFSPTLRDAIKRMQASIEKERRHQAEALDHFERALLADQIAAANRCTALYLLGELNRRLGRDREAVTWFDKALESPEPPADLAAWVHQQRGLAAGQDNN
ncbi:MAG TPA: DUF2225 domain-containing protein [Phycisphaerae bacterium]|nr:DUF2225 domain-containing protein [Phycisphaerae bacterium]